MRRAVWHLLLFTLLAAACGVKPELPSQIPSTEVLGDESYTLPYYWVIGGVTDMLVHRGTRIFSIIQDADSVSIYPTYARGDTLPSHKRLFTGLTAPRLLADGSDHKFRLWVYDDGDATLKGFDGGEFLDTLTEEIAHSDPAWQDVVAVAADNEARVFVADRAANKIYRYRVSDPPAPELEADGEIQWVSQQAGATVRDLAYSAGWLVLLDDGLGTIQLLDPASELDPVFEYMDGVLAQPEAVTANEAHIFVMDRADTTIWEIGWDLEPDGARRVNEGANQVLRNPTAFTVNESKVYVADIEQGRVFDYEKRQ